MSAPTHCPDERNTGMLSFGWRPQMGGEQGTGRFEFLLISGAGQANSYLDREHATHDYNQEEIAISLSNDGVLLSKNGRSQAGRKRRNEAMLLILWHSCEE